MVPPAELGSDSRSRLSQAGRSPRQSLLALSQAAGLQGPAKSQGQGFLACPREGDGEDDGGCG